MTRQTITGGIVTRLIRGRVKTLNGFTTPPFIIRTDISGKATPKGALPSTVIILPNATAVAGRSNQIKLMSGTTTELYDWGLVD